MSGLEELRIQVDRLKRTRELAREVVRREQRLTIEKEDELQWAMESQNIVQGVAQSIQQQVHSRIASVVSKCLSSIFDEPYQFEIRFERKRGRTEAKLVFLRDGVEVDPMDASGGGVVDVAAFALRLASVVLSQPPRRRILILDEPFKFVSAEYRDRVRSLLETLAEKMGFQFIMVSHIAELETGNVVRL